MTCPSSEMYPQVIAQEGLVERLARLFGARMGVRVDKAGDQQALGGQFGAGDRGDGPPVTVGEQVGSPLGRAMPRIRRAVIAPR